MNLFKSLKICGVYRILNNITGKIYIGSSSNIFRRIEEHFYFLYNNKHQNIFLQNSYNKYQKLEYKESDIWVCEILEECDKNKLIELEQEWLNKTECFKHHIGYNISCFSGRPPLMTEEQRKKHNKFMSERMSGTKNPMYKKPSFGGKNRKMTDELKKLISNGLKKYYADNINNRKSKSCKKIERINMINGEVREYESIASTINDGFSKTCIHLCLSR